MKKVILFILILLTVTSVRAQTRFTPLSLDNKTVTFKQTLVANQSFVYLQDSNKTYRLTATFTALKTMADVFTSGNYLVFNHSTNYDNFSNILYVGAGRKYATIQAAINAATPGTLIKVGNGNYTENLSIWGKYRIAIESEVRSYWNGTTLKDGAILTGSIVIYQSLDVTINKIGIICTAGNNGITILTAGNKTKNIYLNDLVIKGITNMHGILIEEGGNDISNITVKSCEIYQGAHGFIAKSQNTTFIDCYATKMLYFGFGGIADNGFGAALTSKAKNIYFTNCHADSCGTGFTVYGKDWFSETAVNVTDTTRNVILTGCSATNGIDGLKIGATSAYPFPKLGTGTSQVLAKDIIVNGFYATNNSGYGIYLVQGDRITINGGSVNKNVNGFNNVSCTNVHVNGLVNTGNTTNYYAGQNINDKLMVKDSTAAPGVYDYVTRKQLNTNGQWVKSGSAIYYNIGNIGIGTSTIPSAITLRSSTSMNDGILFGDANIYRDGVNSLTTTADLKASGTMLQVSGYINHNSDIRMLNKAASGYLSWGTRVTTGGEAVMSLTNIGTISALPTYNITVGATNRALYIDNTGSIGYLSSSKRYKTSIVSMEDVSWLYSLRPVNYILKNDNTKQKQYGLIAEEVDLINKSFVSYNNSGTPETVSYQLLITPMLKAIQQQQEEIQSLLSRLDKVEKTTTLK